MAEEKKEEVLEEVLEDLEAEDAKKAGRKHRIPPQKKKKLRSHIRGMERRIQQCWSRDRKKEILHRFWE